MTTKAPEVNLEEATRQSIDQETQFEKGSRV